MTDSPEITLRTLDALPAASRLRELCIANATLDAILWREWQFRYFSYNARRDAGEEMASLRNGSGSEHYAVFTDRGVFLKGFDPGSPLSKGDTRWVTERVPDDMRAFLAEPAFEMDHVSYCIWFPASCGRWQHGDPPVDSLLDVPLGYLGLLTDDPLVYARWASEYYEQEVPVESVRWVQSMTPLDADVVASLDPELDLSELAADLEEIGFPSA